MSILSDVYLQRLWQEAQEQPEWAATRLWEYIFHHMVFTDVEWSVSSQQPPTKSPGDLRRVDIVVERMGPNAETIGCLFVEIKRASATPSAVEEVEYQAFTAACAYFVETRTPHIWAMTCVGSAARIWIFNESSTYLIPFVPPGDALAEKSEYLEMSTRGKDIIGGLEYIKKHPVPPRKLLENPPSPRPAHAALPPDWHDAEVADLDSVHWQTAAPGTFTGWESGQASQSFTGPLATMGEEWDSGPFAPGPEEASWTAEGPR